MLSFSVLTTCGDSLTTLIGVSLKSLLAAAHEFVVDYLALSRGPAGAGAREIAHSTVVDHLALSGGDAGLGARVVALLVDAGQVTGALSGCPALGLAVGRAALIARQAGAGCNAVYSPALRVWPTWIRIAGIHWQSRCLSFSY